MKISDNNQYQESDHSLQEEGWISSNNPSPILSELSHSSDFEIIADQTNLIFPAHTYNQTPNILPVK